MWAHCARPKLYHLRWVMTYTLKFLLSSVMALHAARFFSIHPCCTTFLAQLARQHRWFYVPIDGMPHLAYLGQMMEKSGGFVVTIFPEGLVLSWIVPIHSNCMYMHSLLLC